jgi:predicted methyltransferase
LVRQEIAMIRKTAAALAAALLVSAAGAAMAQAPSAAITAAVADSGRPDADKARDGARKPAETLAFAGVKPGDKVAELIPGGGYYTRLLAKAVGPSGKVYAIVPPAMAARPGALDGLNAIAAANPNVQVVTADPTSFTLPEKVDLVWTSENYHDLHNGPNADIQAFNKAVLDALKPGGTFYVEDHNAKAGSPADVTSKLHRIESATAKRELQAAGFRLDAEGSFLKNPQDPGDVPVRENSVAGKTDKFALRLKKPA